jgi:signal transduction histidine kinase
LFLDKYRSIDIAGGFESSFPRLADKVLFHQYRQFQQQSVSLIPSLIAFIFVVFQIVVIRFNLPDLFLGVHEHPLILCSQAFVLPPVTAFFLYAFSQFYLLYCRRNPLSLTSSSPDDQNKFLVLKRRCEKCLEYPLEDIICIFSTLSLVCLFLGRVLTGQCPENVSIWESQQCNPVANSKSFPHDDVISFYLAPIFYTVLFRRMSMMGGFISYAIAAVAVLYATTVVDGKLQCYSILWIFVYIFVSIELERWMRVSFVRHKLLLDSQQTAIAAAENEAKARIEMHNAQAAQTAAESAAQIQDLNNKAHLAVKEQEMMRHIMGNVAHDMKTPLHSINAELESFRNTIGLAIEEAVAPGADPSSVFIRLKQQTDELVDDVVSITHFLVMSINRSQDFVKLSSNIALKPKLETVSVPDVNRFVSKCMGHQNNGRIIAMHPLVLMCPSIITDKHFLTDNLLCLVSNAVKYSDSGATIDVRISLIQVATAASSALQSAPQPMVMVMVEDTGIGISDDLKVALFQPFQQAQRSAGGTGLGLFSLAGRVKALGGTCGVRDRDDGKQGSVFWFTFPYRPDELSEVTDECGAGAGAGGGLVLPIPPPVDVKEASPALPPLRILLTDDSASILKVTKRFLERNGHTVETAENGNQSLERLKAKHGEFDLLITDLQMPVMDGFEAVRRYREWEAGVLQLNQGSHSSHNGHNGHNGHSSSDSNQPSHNGQSSHNGHSSSDISVTAPISTPPVPTPSTALTPTLTPPAPTPTPTSTPATRRLFIVGMSAKADDETKADVFSVGMDAFLAKPFDYKTLLDELKRSPVFGEMIRRR